jgi:predicted transcriptional regulator
VVMDASEISIEESLKRMGWTELEARVYVALHQAGEALTGYQCAKAARAPRPNVYPALERLVRRGAILEVPDAAVPRYQAVPFSQLKRNMVAHVTALLDQVDAALAGSPDRPQMALARGDDALRQHGGDLIDRAMRHLDVGASAGTVAPFQTQLDEARRRGVAVTFYCFDRCPAPGCGVCVNPVPLSDGPFQVHGWLTLMADARTVLMATNVGHDPSLLLTDLPPLSETVRTLFSRLQPAASQRRDDD